MTFMGSLEARKGNWGLLGDLIYLKVSADDSAKVEVPALGPIPMPVKVDADVSVKNRIATLGGAYTIVDTGKATLSLLRGARCFSLDLDLKLDLSSVVTNRSLRASRTSSAVVT